VTKKLPNTCEVPPGVVTVTVLAPAAAFVAIVIEIGRFVGVPPGVITALTPAAPMKFTAVAPARFVPRITAGMITGIAADGTPAFGYNAVIDGVCAAANRAGTAIKKNKSAAWRSLRSRIY
jgi:hypothetical protein